MYIHVYTCKGTLRYTCTVKSVHIHDDLNIMIWGLYTCMHYSVHVHVHVHA